MLISVLSDYLTPLSDERRFDWLYKDGPYGPARAWLALEGCHGKAIGASAAFPRTVLVNGIERKAWVLGDFCISGEHRSLGPALQLQRATLKAIDDGEVDFCYDFPSRQMEAIYRRMGVGAATKFVRLSKPVLVNSKVTSLLGPGVFASSVRWTLNSALRIAGSVASTSKWTIGLHTGEFDREFAELYRRSGNNSFGCGMRSAEYLNWRFLRHANTVYQVLTARESGALEAFAVFSTANRAAEVAEIGFSAEQAVGALLKELSSRLRRSQIESIHVFLTQDDPRRQTLERNGFWSRESTPVVVYWPKQKQDAGKELSWSLTQADRDS